MEKTEIAQLLLSAAQYRHACKEFDQSRKVADEDFRLIMELCRLSPSSFGLEPWKFLIVQDATLREHLRSCTWGGQKQLPTASHVVVALAKKECLMRWDSAYVTHIMNDVQQHPVEVQLLRKKNLERFQRSDFALAGSPRAMRDWAAKQAYIPLANMISGAAALGIDSCPIEGFDMQALDAALSQYFGVDTQQYGAAYMVCFGYRAADPRPKTRQSPDDVFQWFA